jgi:hypothetical protein
MHDFRTCWCCVDNLQGYILGQHLNVGKILDLLSLEKDVDGFHPLNMGNLAMRGREPLFIPCTPKGCIELLIRSGLEIMGKKAVVIGRSNIVGLPTSLLLQVTPNLSKCTANSASLPRLSRHWCSICFAEAPCNCQHRTCIYQEPRTDHL